MSRGANPASDSEQAPRVQRASPATEGSKPREGAARASPEVALALEDGGVFVGEPFGAAVDAAAEVVFNTGMTGYQEVASDPSYRGQMVVMTHPQIGNYGVSAAGAESVRPWIAAMIVRDLAAHPHHWQAADRLEDYLAAHGVPGLQGVDTRALVRRLRETGTQRGVLRRSGPGGFTPAEVEALRQAARAAPSVSQLELVGDVSAVLPVGSARPADGRHVAVLDCGIKWNILRSLARRHITPRVYAWDARADDILADRPRAIVVSNGPGDPARLPTVVAGLRTLVGSGIPILGICLGHQLLGLAAGGTTSRLPYGHHGGNHPVRELASGRVTITTQNHEFQVDRDSLPPASGFEVSHVNLNDGSVEGLTHRELPVFSVQYHPEGCPGPQDSQPLFDRLLDLAADHPNGVAV
jgi:carbamoyl-phosphate synthase small subunit